MSITVPLKPWDTVPGIQAAETVAGTGAKKILTGSVGPKAFQALQAVGIEIGQDLGNITVRQALERYKNNDINGHPDRIVVKVDDLNLHTN
jgi:predicted Fe-Mo cluster-binding NifX family protein